MNFYFSIYFTISYMKMSFKWIITKAFSVDAIAADACVCSMIAFSPLRPMHAVPQRLLQPPFVLAGKQTMEKQWQRFNHIGILKRRWNFIQNFWFVYLYTHQVCVCTPKKLRYNKRTHKWISINNSNNIKNY